MTAAGSIRLHSLESRCAFYGKLAACALRVFRKNRLRALKMAGDEISAFRRFPEKALRRWP